MDGLVLCVVCSLTHVHFSSLASQHMQTSLYIFHSCEMKLNLDYLVEKIWEYLALICVYTKKRGGEGCVCLAVSGASCVCVCVCVCVSVLLICSIQMCICSTFTTSLRHTVDRFLASPYHISKNLHNTTSPRQQLMDILIQMQF